MSRSSKSILEWEIKHSDRVDLVDSAVSVLAIMTRFKNGGGEDPWCPLRELTEVESNAYNSALTFLAIEFDLGASDTESHMTRSIELHGDDGFRMDCGVVEYGCDEQPPGSVVDGDSPDEDTDGSPVHA